MIVLSLNLFSFIVNIVLKNIYLNNFSDNNAQSLFIVAFSITMKNCFRDFNCMFLYILNT
jgi:hypothetical protein